MITQQQKELDAHEFTSMLLSCGLAVEFNKDKPNKAIKHTLRCVKARVQSNSIKAVCEQGLKSFYPLGWLSKQFNNIGRIGGMSHEVFLSIGASLEPRK